MTPELQNHYNTIRMGNRIAQQATEIKSLKESNARCNTIVEQLKEEIAFHVCCNCKEEMGD